MTSDRPQTEAWEHIDAALMNRHRRVSLSELTPEEYGLVLKSCLDKVNLRELRGFKPLRSNITWRPGSVLYGAPRIHTLVTEVMDVAEDVLLEVEDVEDFDLSSHSLKLTSVDSVVVYRRHESSDETTSWEVANGWGAQAYPFRGQFSLLVLRRPRDHSDAVSNLISVMCFFKKISHRHVYEIKQINTLRIGVNDFFSHFGANAPTVLRGLVNGIRAAYRETHEALKGLTEATGRDLETWERLADSIW